MDDIVPDIPTDESFFTNENYYSELMRFLSESPSMRQTAKSSIKQSLFSASGAFAGSFVGGPVGGLVGGIVGSLVGFIKSDDYDGAIVALTRLESERQKALMAEVISILKAGGATYRGIESVEAFRDALYGFAEQESVRNGIWNACLHSARS